MTGELKDFALFTDIDKQSFSVNGGFAHAGIAPLNQFPGFENLSGRINGSESQGVLELVAVDAVFTAPRLFREPLPLNRLNGLATWRQNSEGLIFDSSLLEMESRTFKSKTRLHLPIPQTGEDTFIDLQSLFSFADVNETKHFLPAKILGVDVVSCVPAFFSIPTAMWSFPLREPDLMMSGSNGAELGCRERSPE